MLRRRDDLGEYARLALGWAVTASTDIWMSTEQFDYVLGVVGPHISRLPTVYVQGVRRRTQCERRLRSDHK